MPTYIKDHSQEILSSIGRKLESGKSYIDYKNQMKDSDTLVCYYTMPVNNVLVIMYDEDDFNNGITFFNNWKVTNYIFYVFPTNRINHNKII